MLNYPLGGGFSLTCQDFGGRSFIPYLCFFFSMEIGLHTDSIVAHRAKMTVADFGLTSCVWANFPARIPHYAWTAQSAHSNFDGSWVYVCLSVMCRLHFWQNGWGLLHATAVTRGGTDTLRESAQKVNPGEETSPAPPARTRNSQPFDHEFGALPTSYPGSPVGTCICTFFLFLFPSSHSAAKQWQKIRDDNDTMVRDTQVFGLILSTPSDQPFYYNYSCLRRLRRRFAKGV